MQKLLELERVVDGADQFHRDGGEHGVIRKARAEQQARDQHDGPQDADEIEQQRVEPVGEQLQRLAADRQPAAVLRAQEHDERRADQDEREQDVAADAVGHVGRAGRQEEDDAGRGCHEREREELRAVELPDHVQAVDQRVHEIDGDHVAGPEDREDPGRHAQQRGRGRRIAADRLRQRRAQHDRQRGQHREQRQKHEPRDREHRVERRKAGHRRVIRPELPETVDHEHHQRERGRNFIDNRLIFRLFCSSFVLRHNLLSFD